MSSRRIAPTCLAMAAVVLGIFAVYAIEQVTGGPLIANAPVVATVSKTAVPQAAGQLVLFVTMLLGLVLVMGLCVKVALRIGRIFDRL